MKFFTMPLLESRYEVHYCKIFAPISQTKKLFSTELIRAGNDESCETKARNYVRKLLANTKPLDISKVVKDKNRYCTLSIYKVNGTMENGKFIPVCYNTVKRLHIPFEVIKGK